MPSDPDPVPIGDLLRGKAEEIAAKGLAAGRVAAGGPVPGDEPDDRREARRQTWADLVPPAYGSPKLADLDDEVREPLAAWSSTVLDRGYENLLLCGPVGTGKTHAAYAALRPAVGADRRVAGYFVAQLLQDLRPSDDPEIEARARAARRRVETCDLLLLDDVGVEKASEWTVERLGVIVHGRWEARLPVVMTTNLPLAELADVLTERAYSRFAENLTIVRLTGHDRRNHP